VLTAGKQDRPGLNLYVYCLTVSSVVSDSISFLNSSISPFLGRELTCNKKEPTLRLVSDKLMTDHTR